MNKILAALVLEADSAKPTEADLPALQSAIKKAEDANKKYKEEDYVLGEGLDDVINEAKGLLNDNVGLNGFTDEATYYAYNQAIDAIENALVKKANTLKYETNEFDKDTGKVKVTVSVKNVLGSTSGDGKDYGYAYQIGSLWFDPSATTAGVKDFDKAFIKPIGKGTDNGGTWADGGEQYPSKWISQIELSNFSNTNSGKFASGDKIKISFYEKDAAGNFKKTAFTSVTITVSEGYAGPVIKSAKVTTYSESASITYLNKELIGGDQVSVSGYPEVAGPTVQVTLTDKLTGYDKNIVSVKNSKDKVAASKADDTQNNPITLTTDGDEYLVAGDMKVMLEVAMTGEEEDDYIARSTATVKIDPLSKWGLVPALKKVVAAAGELVQSDYQIVEDGTGRIDVKTVADAFRVINKDVSKISSDIASTTLANSMTNRNAVLKVLSDMLSVCEKLEKKDADADDLLALLAEANAKVGEDEDENYTFDSLGKLQDLIDEIEAKEYDRTGLEDALQSEIDAYYKELDAAIKGLTKEGAVDKSALEAAIEKAGALKEEDYTPESWAAAKPAIDAAVAAAQTVVDNAEATQAQVTNALNALNAAMATLVSVEPEGPQPPKSGTGWVYDPETGDYYFFKNNELVSNYWVGKVDGASQWDGNWYYVGSDGKLFTGMTYIDDLHGGYGWYFLQPTNANGEIGKMLTGWQWVGGQYGTCYFSAKNGEAGKCTYSTELGNWNGTTWVK